MVLHLPTHHYPCVHSPHRACHAPCVCYRCASSSAPPTRPRKSRARARAASPTSHCSRRRTNPTSSPLASRMRHALSQHAGACSAFFAGSSSSVPPCLARPVRRAHFESSQPVTQLPLLLRGAVWVHRMLGEKGGARKVRRRRREFCVLPGLRRQVLLHRPTRDLQGLDGRPPPRGLLLPDALPLVCTPSHDGHEASPPRPNRYAVHGREPQP